MDRFKHDLYAQMHVWVSVRLLQDSERAGRGFSTNSEEQVPKTVVRCPHGQGDDRDRAEARYNGQGLHGSDSFARSGWREVCVSKAIDTVGRFWAIKQWGIQDQSTSLLLRSTLGITTIIGFVNCYHWYLFRAGVFRWLPRRCSPLSNDEVPLLCRALLLSSCSC